MIIKLNQTILSIQDTPKEQDAFLYIPNFTATTVNYNKFNYLKAEDGKETINT